MKRHLKLSTLVMGACTLILWGLMGYLLYDTVDSRGDKGGETPSLPVICHDPASNAEINMPELDSSKSHHNQCVSPDPAVNYADYMTNHTVLTGSYH